MHLTASSDESGISVEMRRALVDRILASASFSRSDRLSKFLKYACQKTIEGRFEDLTEYQVGLNVFGRSDRYSPGEDSIVRSHARLLRQRLDVYFENEGKDEEIRVNIPKGSYSLHFERRQPLTTARPQTPLTQEIIPEGHPPKPVPRPSRHWIWVGGAGLLIAMSCLLVWLSRPVRLVDSVWQRVFMPNIRTIIVPADSTLALFEDMTKHVIPLSDYLTHDFHEYESLAPFGNRFWSSGRRYTSMADLQISARLMRLPETAGKEVIIKYARDLQMADLKGSSCVLLGGVRANPWQEIFQDKLNFHIGFDPAHGENRIVNVSPRTGESSTYNESSAPSYHRAYGSLAILPSLTSGTSAVIIQGTSTAGTEAAADFLFDNSRFEEFLRTIAAGAKRAPFFEVLLQAESVGGNAQRATVIGSRVISQVFP